MVPFQNSFTNRLSTVIYLTLYLCAVAVILFAISQNKCTESQNEEIGYATSNAVHFQYTCWFCLLCFKRTKSQQFFSFFFLLHVYYLLLCLQLHCSFFSFQLANLQTWSMSRTSRSKGRKYFALRCGPHRGEAMHKYPC